MAIVIGSVVVPRDVTREDRNKSVLERTDSVMRIVMSSKACKPMAIRLSHIAFAIGVLLYDAAAVGETSASRQSHKRKRSNREDEVLTQVNLGPLAGEPN